MFDVAPSELIVLGTVALLVIPPKDLPKAMRVAGYWVGRARSVARQFRAGFDDMLRDAELKEMEARWAAENERIMREHPMPQMLPIEAPQEVPHGGPAADIGEAPGASKIESGDLDGGEAPPVLVDKPVVVGRLASPRKPGPKSKPKPARPAADPTP